MPIYAAEYRNKLGTNSDRLNMNVPSKSMQKYNKFASHKVEIHSNIRTKRTKDMIMTRMHKIYGQYNDIKEIKKICNKYIRKGLYEEKTTDNIEKCHKTRYTKI